MLQGSGAHCLFSLALNKSSGKVRIEGLIFFFFFTFQSEGKLFPSLWHFYHRSLYLAVNWTNYVFLAYIFKPQTLLIRTPLLCVQSVCCATWFSSIAPLHSPPPWPASLVQLRNSCITVTVSHGLTLPLWLQIATQASVVARWCSFLPSEASVSLPFSQAVLQGPVWLAETSSRTVPCLQPRFLVIHFYFILSVFIQVELRYNLMMLPLIFIFPSCLFIIG